MPCMFCPTLQWSSLSGISLPSLIPSNVSHSAIHFLSFFKNLIYVFIWLHWVHRIFDLHCSMRTLSWGMWDLVLWPGVEPQPPALGAWSVSHWTTREVPIYFLESTMYLQSPAPLHMLLSAWNALPCLVTSLSISPCWKSHRLSPLAVKVSFLVTVLSGWASPRGGSSDERCSNSSSSMLSISRGLLDSLALARFEHKKGLYT